jgi:hypothetical protein
MILKDMMAFRKMNPDFDKFPIRYMPGVKKNNAVVEAYTAIIRRWNLTKEQWYEIPMNCDVVESLDVFLSEPMKIKEVLSRTTLKNKRRILDTAGRHTLLWCLSKMDIHEDIVRHIMAFAVSV